MSKPAHASSATRADAALADVRPRYATVASALATDILEGRQATGVLLPPEAELCRRFGVSRATVREALRRLREMGLVAASRGVGTRVVADRLRSDYVLAVRSAAEVMGYAGATALDVTRRRSLRASAALARRIGCAPGDAWRHVAGVRRTAPGGAAISCVDLFIAAEFADVADSPELVSTPAYRLIAQSRGIAVAEIRQEIGAVALDPAQAATLGAPPGSPGLHIRRRFLAADGRLLEATLNVHPAGERFAYALRLGQPDEGKEAVLF